MNVKQLAAGYIAALTGLLNQFDVTRFERMIDLMLDAYRNGRHIFVMGNGGSGATASHFACDINKGCCSDLDLKFKMICLNDSVPTLLALANDVSYDAVFVEQMKNFFVPGDLAVGISGSGNSENVIRAIRHAKANGGRTIALTGFSGGRLAREAEVAYVVPIDDMQKVEDLHVILVHMIMQTVHSSLHEHAETGAAKG